MKRILIPAAGLLLLAACSSNGSAGPARSAEPSNIGNNTAGVFQPNDRAATGINPSGTDGVGTNGQMSNPGNAGN